jgi:hypothetical protein
MPTLQEAHNSGDSTQAILSVTNAWYSETWTTLSAYTIGSVKLKLFRDVGVTGTITVSIRATSGNLPTGADLASGTFDISSLLEGAPGDYVEISFDTPAALSASTVYAIVIRDDTSNNTYIRATTGNAYAGGRACISANSGSSWAEWGSGLDFMFETYDYVAPPPPPPEPVLGSAIMLGTEF